jgi:hypothetical protein
MAIHKRGSAPAKPAAAKAAPKKPLGKPATKPAPAPEPEEEETVTVQSTVVPYVSVARSVTLDVGGGSVSATVSVAAESYDAAVELLEAEDILSKEAEKLNAFAQANFEPASTEAEEGEADDDSGDADEEAGDEDEGDIGPDQINEMDREAIENLISENGIDVNPKDFKKTKAGLADLRAAVIAAAFGDEAEEEEAEEDEADDEEGGEDEESADISEEDINAMDRDELVALIEENGLEVAHKKITKLPALKKAVIEAIAAASEDEDGEGDEDESGDEDEEAEAEAYTRDDLNKMNVSDLKEIYRVWELGAFPKGAPPVQKKVAISAILKAQEG